jgi:hypothetical protein
MFINSIGKAIKNVSKEKILTKQTGASSLMIYFIFSGFIRVLKIKTGSVKTDRKIPVNPFPLSI